MIPDIPVMTTVSNQTVASSKTWRLKNNRLISVADELMAVIQSVYLALQTPRYKLLIYSWQYGSELYTLIGKDEEYVISEAQRMIVDALSIDERITNVYGFRYVNGTMYFLIDTIYGTASIEKELIY